MVCNNHASNLVEGQVLIVCGHFLVTYKLLNDLYCVVLFLRIRRPPPPSPLASRLGGGKNAVFIIHIYIYIYIIFIS